MWREFLLRVSVNYECPFIIIIFNFNLQSFNKTPKLEKITFTILTVRIVGMLTMDYSEMYPKVCQGRRTSAVTYKITYKKQNIVKTIKYII